MVSHSDPDEIKQVMVIRADLQMGKGKIAAQSAHASIDAYIKAQHRDGQATQKWLDNGMPKSVLKVEDERELVEIFQKAKDMGVPVSLITDAGKTQIMPGTKTCVGLGPTRAEKIDEITGELKLL